MKWNRLTILFGTWLAMAVSLQGQEADRQLEVFFQRHLENQFRSQPLSATQLGDHRFDHLLDDVSAPARSRQMARVRETLAALDKDIPRTQLSRNALVDFEIFRQELVRSLWLMENTRPFEEDPRVYNDYINDSIYLLLAQSTQPRETNVANSILRMRKIPEIIGIAQATLKNPPRVLVETAIRQNRGAIAFYEKDIYPLAGDSPQLGQLRAAASPIVSRLKEYQEFLQNELLNRAKGDWRVGKEKFNQKLILTLDAGMNADQVLADAEAEFQRVNRDLYVLARQVWSRYFPKSLLPTDDEEGRRKTISEVLNAIGNEHGKPEDLIRDAQASVSKIKTFIQQNDLLTLPNPDRCKIIEMPEFKRGNSIAYLESAPPLDPSAGTFYAISPPPADWDATRVTSFLQEYNRHMLQILTIHEAYPGHYVQLEYSNRARSLIRKILQSGVFIEGWAVYTEQTMLDQGYGDGDIALRLSQLKFYLRAVANAILDHKMHCTEMTDEEALKFLTEGAFQSEGEASLKIIRSKQSSVQLSTYFVGRMALYRLRQQFQKELGAKFNLGRFHETVLSQGSVPPRFLPELVRRELALENVR